METTFSTPSKSRLAQFARECHALGYKHEQIKKDLIENGLNEEEAEKILTDLFEKIQKEQEQKPALARTVRAQTLRNGILWLGGGALVTFIGYMNASSGGNGGVYYITTGAILYGLYQIIAALFIK
jgi:hypothetical protein